MPAHYDPKKIKRLVVFGDSWTAGHGIETDIRYEEVARPEPFIERLRSHNAWCRWLADKMDLPFVNMGQPGICNAGIKRKIRENINFCDPERDLIIVMLTYPYRHHLWMDTLDQDEIALKDIIDNIFSMLSGHNTFYCNAFYPLFREEPELVPQLNMERFILPTVTAADVLLHHEHTLDISVWEYDKRHVSEDHKGFTTGDYHPNLRGHRIIADWLYSILTMHYARSS